MLNGVFEWLLNFRKIVMIFNDVTGRSTAVGVFEKETSYNFIYDYLNSLVDRF